MRKHVRTAAITALTLVLLAGCGKNSASAQLPDDSSYVPEDTLSVSEDTLMLGNDNIADDESMTESEMIRTAGDTENVGGNIDEELPDYLRGDTESAAIEPSSGTEVAEGANIAAGTEITASANAEKCELGETYTIHTNTGDIDLNVKSVDVVKNTDDSIKAKKIARVSYTYTNVSSDSGLIIDDIFFRLADSKGKSINIYVPDYARDENPEPAVVEKGESCEAVIAFALYEDTDTMTLYFNDQTTGMGGAQELIWTIE